MPRKPNADDSEANDVIATDQDNGAHDAVIVDASAQANESKKLPQGHVRARVLKRGDGKIYKGVFNPIARAEEKYAHGDEFTAPKGAVAALEERGYAEEI